MNIRTLLWTVCLFLISSIVSAQITGTVFSGDDNLPLPGVQVVIKGTTIGTTTDLDGKYYINGGPGEVLVFSCIGMTTATLTIGTESVYNIRLIPDEYQMGDVVVTALGTRNKSAMREDKRSYKKFVAGNTEIINDYLRIDTATEFTKLLNENSVNIVLSDIDSLFICPPLELNRLDDLLDGSQKFVYTVDKKSNAKAKILAFFNINYEEGKKYLISDFVQYKDVPCPQRDEKIVRYGVGVRTKIYITNIKAGVEVNIPAQVAAAAQMGQCEASYMVETIGFSTKESRKIMSDLNGSFDVTEFVKVSKAEELLIESLEDEMKVNPKMIPIKEM